MKLRTRAWAAALFCIVTAAAHAANAGNYTAILTGAQEAPRNSSPGLGAAIVQFDADTHVLQISATFAALMGDTTAAHIHCCTATPDEGVAGIATNFAGFPLGVRDGIYSRSYNTSLTSLWSADFLSAHGGTTAGAEAAFLAGLNAGTGYINIHSSAYPNGEIRGFLSAVTAVPEPGAFVMLGLGAPLVLLAARRRRNKST